MARGGVGCGCSMGRLRCFLFSPFFVGRVFLDRVDWPEIWEGRCKRMRVHVGSSVPVDDWVAEENGKTADALRRSVE